MVENMDDNPVDRKPSFIDYFVKVEAFVKVEVAMKVEALPFNSGVSNLRDNEVDTTHFFSSQDTWKDKDDLLGWVRRQANMAGFTVVIKRSCALRNQMLELICERSGEHKVPNKKLKREITRTIKCGCLFKVRAYVVTELNAWKSLVIHVYFKLKNMLNRH
jgi:hypothetical protein